MAKDKKEIVDLDAGYQERLDEIKKKQAPLGHLAAPSIPRLDQPPPDRWQGVQNAPGPLMRPEQAAELARKGGFIPGVGSMYAANQPALQRPPASQAPQTSQPVVGHVTPAQGPPGQRQPMPSPEEFVKKYGASHTTQSGSTAPDQGHQIQAGPQIPLEPSLYLSPQTADLLVQASAAAKAESGSQVVSEEEKLKGEIDELDDTIFDAFGNKVRDLFNNKKRRAVIELRCPELSLDDLLIHQELRQVVPIIPKKFLPTFRMPSGEEDLFVKSLIRTEEGTSRYILDKFAMMNLCLGMYALNGSPFPNHINDSGTPDPKLFDIKFKVLIRFPLPILADLSVNYIWFDERVRRLVVADGLTDF